MDSIRKDQGERFALHSFGSQHIVPAAAAAARAVFEACGGAAGWRHWAIPDGKFVKMAHTVLARFIDDHPDAPAEAAYKDLREFPAFIGEHVAWADAPLQVRGAYEAFCAIYRRLWSIVRANDTRMAQALAWRPPPRLVPAERYLPKLSHADVVELQEKLALLGYSAREIKYRLTDPCFQSRNRDRVLEDAEDDAYYRAWCTEKAKTDSGFPSFPEHELRPDRPYLQAVYEKWDAYYASPRALAQARIHAGLSPKGRR